MRLLPSKGIVAMRKKNNPSVSSDNLSDNLACCLLVKFAPGDDGTIQIEFLWCSIVRSNM